MKRSILLICAWACGIWCVSQSWAVPGIVRINRNSSSLKGRIIKNVTTPEPAYKPSKYYPPSYPEYGRDRVPSGTGWQNVPDNQSGTNHTPSYGVGSPRSARKHRYSY